MKISEYHYHLPPELVARHPVETRDGSRLMVIERQSGRLQHCRFSDLPRFLGSEDLLVLNNTRVIPARLYASREARQERIEVLLVRQLDEQTWEALVRPGRKARPGIQLVFEPGLCRAAVLEGGTGAVRRLRFQCSEDLQGWIEKHGKTPLPPYLGREATDEDRKRYQTVYARHRGSVAAPTAGLHFTRELLQQLPSCELTLHVGYGTFKPIEAENVGEHRMDFESYRLDEGAAARIAGCLRRGGRVVAVGTTTTRVLEHVASTRGEMVADEGWTDLFIYPGFRFQAVQGLVTNFHLPGSTLLLLVAAFAGKELILECYREAVRERYRFYSYGDAMLII